MRSSDRHKTAFENAARTISFEVPVLHALELRARQENTTVSVLLNAVCRSHIMGDEQFYREMARQHFLEFQKFQALQVQVATLSEQIRANTPTGR